MGQLFYDHLIDSHYLYNEIELLDLEPEVHLEIIQNIDSTIHHQIIEIILVDLSPTDQKEFLQLLAQKPHDPSILDYLKTKILGIEQKIISHGEQLQYQLLKLVRGKND